MDKINDSAMVALLPTTSNWCNIDLPHTTLVYVGKIAQLEPTIREELVKIVSNLVLLAPPFTLKVSAVQKYGEEEPVDVLTLIRTPELMALRSFLEDWDNGEFPDYNPHATIGPLGSFRGEIPLTLSFDKILVSWGEDDQTFPLRNY
jgi:2'-5' RNA ligase